MAPSNHKKQRFQQFPRGTRHIELLARGNPFLLQMEPRGAVEMGANGLEKQGFCTGFASVVRPKWHQVTIKKHDFDNFPRGAWNFAVRSKWGQKNFEKIGFCIRGAAEMAPSNYKKLRIRQFPAGRGASYRVPRGSITPCLGKLNLVLRQYYTPGVAILLLLLRPNIVPRGSITPFLANRTLCCGKITTPGTCEEYAHTQT